MRPPPPKGSIVCAASPNTTIRGTAGGRRRTTCILRIMTGEVSSQERAAAAIKRLPSDSASRGRCLRSRCHFSSIGPGQKMLARRAAPRRKKVGPSNRSTAYGTMIRFRVNRSLPVVQRPIHSKGRNESLVRWLRLIGPAESFQHMVGVAGGYHHKTADNSSPWPVISSIPSGRCSKASAFTLGRKSIRASRCSRRLLTST